MLGGTLRKLPIAVGKLLAQAGQLRLELDRSVIGRLAALARDGGCGKLGLLKLRLQLCDARHGRGGCALDLCGAGLL